MGARRHRLEDHGGGVMEEGMEGIEGGREGGREGIEGGREGRQRA